MNPKLHKGVFKFLFDALPVRDERAEEPVKSRTVVAVFQVAEFMGHHVIEALPGGSNQLAVEG